MYALMLTVLASGLAGGLVGGEVPVMIYLPSEDPGLEFAAEEIVAANPKDLMLVHVGKPVADRRPAIVAEVSEPPVTGQPESFRIEKRGPHVYVIGQGRGLMYGLLEVADQLKARGRWEITEGTHAPYVAMRGLKFNMPLAGGGYIGSDKIARGAWFFDLDFWERFLTMMARNRYNVLTLWSAHPYHHLVKLDKFPEATDVPPEQIDRNIAMFRQVLHRATELGIDVYVITWNIHVSPTFAKAHNVPEQGQDTPLVREYMRECVRALVDTYPELTGVGTCPGERMPMSAQEKQAWIADTYLAGMRRAARQPPFMLRYWQGDPQATADMLDREKWPAPVYITVKFNGEHMYSSPEFHLQDHRWLTLAENRYKVVWHLRNDCIFIYRWGDPEFARATLTNTRADYSCGYFMGSESLVPGVDMYHTEQAQDHVAGQYEFEKNWFLYALWGRLGYDPKTPNELFLVEFQRRFGTSGDAAYKAMVSASRIIPRTTAFHWNYMNGDWRPEENRGSWNTSYELPIRSYRDDRAFHSVMEYIFNATIDDSMVCIPDFVALTVAGKPAVKAGQLSPYDVADALEEDAQAAKAAIEQAMRLAGEASPELVCTRADVLAQADLGLYYAEKIRAATELCFYLVQGDAKRQRLAVAHLEAAKARWEDVIRDNAIHYSPSRWEQSRPDLDLDIKMAKEAAPIPRAETAWEVTAAPASVAGWPVKDPGGWQPLMSMRLRYEGESTLIPWYRRMNALMAGDLVEPARAVGGKEASAYYARQKLSLDKPATVQVIVTSRAAFRLAMDEKIVMASPPAVGRWETVELPGGTHQVSLELTGADPAFTLDCQPLPVLQPVVLREAAKADEIVPPMLVQEVEGAIGGTAVVVPRDAGRGDDAQGNPLDHGWLSVKFSVPADGEYRIYARCYWPATTANSLFIQVDEGKIEQFGQDEIFGQWHWVASRSTYRLLTGQHTVRLRTRETDTRVDQVLVASAR